MKLNCTNPNFHSFWKIGKCKHILAHLVYNMRVCTYTFQLDKTCIFGTILFRFTCMATFLMDVLRLLGSTLMAVAAEKINFVFLAFTL